MATEYEEIVYHPITGGRLVARGAPVADRSTKANRMEVKLIADVQPLLDALAEVADCPLSLRQAVAEIGAVKVDSFTAPGANELVVRLEPSEALLGLVAAARARHANLGAV